MAIESDFMPDLEACFALILTAMGTASAPDGGGSVSYSPPLPTVAAAIAAFLIKYKAYQIYPVPPMPPEVLPTMTLMMVDTTL